MQFASKGQWGRGLYFAEEAGYSHFYATKGASPPPGRDDLPHDECEFMLASLLLGDVVEMDRDENEAIKGACRELTVPPAKSACRSKTLSPVGDGVDRLTAPPQQGSGTKYNTLRGYTQTDRRDGSGKWHKNDRCPRSKVWIVYENGRACARPDRPGCALTLPPTDQPSASRRPAVPRAVLLRRI